MYRSRNWICSVSSTRLAAMRPNPIASLHSAFLTSPPPASILAESVKPSQSHAMFWKCTDASSATRKPFANFNAWIDDYSLSTVNYIKSPQPKNEERLAGQGAAILAASLPVAGFSKVCAELPELKKARSKRACRQDAGPTSQSNAV